MNLILVCMVCQCNVYVIPESIRRKDLGYKGYEFLTIASFVALLLLPCLLDFNLLSLSVSSAVDLLPACFRFSNMNNPAVDLLPACFRFSNTNYPAVDLLLLLPACFRFSHLNLHELVWQPAEAATAHAIAPADEAANVLAVAPVEEVVSAHAVAPAEEPATTLSVAPAEEAAAALTIAPVGEAVMVIIANAEVAAAFLAIATAQEDAAAYATVPAEEAASVIALASAKKADPVRAVAPADALAIVPAEDAAAQLAFATAEADMALTIALAEEAANVLDIAPAEKDTITPPEKAACQHTIAPVEEAATGLAIAPAEEAVNMLSITLAEEAATVLDIPPADEAANALGIALVADADTELVLAPAKEHAAALAIAPTGEPPTALGNASAADAATMLALEADKVLTIAPKEEGATALAILSVEEDNPALAIASVEEADTDEVEEVTTVLAIAPEEEADAVLTIVPAMEAASVLAATEHVIVPTKEAAPARFIVLTEVAVTVLANTTSVLALASVQNTDPLFALPSTVESANELLITPAEAAATVLPSITPVEEIFTVLAIAPAEEAATALALAHVEVAAPSLSVMHMEMAATALVIDICLPGHCSRCHVQAKESMGTVGSTALWGFYLSEECCQPIHGARFPKPAYGQFLFSTNLTVSERFMFFKELVRLVSNPTAVSFKVSNPGFGSGFRNLVVLVLVNQCVCKCFNSSCNMGTIHSYRPGKWFAGLYSGGSAEFSDSDFDNLKLLPSQLFNASNLAVPAAVTLHAEFFCSPFIFQPGLPGIVSVDLCSLMRQAAYCVDAQDHLGSVLSCMIRVKPTAYCSVVLNLFFPLAGESLFIPTTDQLAQKQLCVPYWIADKELCLTRHCELHDVDCLFSYVQDIKLLIGICAHCDTKLFQMDTTTTFISAALKHGELIYCNPHCGVDLGLGTNGLPSVWKLQAPLESSCLAAMCWTESSSIPIQSCGFVPIRSGGAFWMYHSFLDKMLLCTHVDDFPLAASSLCLAQSFHAHYSLHCDCKFFIARPCVGIDIILDLDAIKTYLSQTTLINRLLEQELGCIMCHEHLTSNDLRYNPGKGSAQVGTALSLFYIIWLQNA